VHRIQVSRQNAVDAGLIKEAVKSIAYLVRTIRKSWSICRQRRWKTAGAHIKPLKYNWPKQDTVNTVNAGASRKHRQAGETRLRKPSCAAQLGPAGRGDCLVYADDPNDDLLAVARDESKEVLIFKVAAALASMRRAPLPWYRYAARKAPISGFR